MTKSKRVFWFVLTNSVNNEVGRRGRSKDAPVGGGPTEQPQVNLKHRLEETHVRALVQTDLMLPQVDNEHLGGGEGEEGRLSLKILS